MRKSKKPEPRSHRALFEPPKPHRLRSVGRGQTIARTFTLYPTDYAKLKALSGGVPRMESAIIRDLIRKATTYEAQDIKQAKQSDRLQKYIERAHSPYIETDDYDNS